MIAAILICLSPWLAVIAVAAWHAYKTNPENQNNDHQ